MRLDVLTSGIWQTNSTIVSGPRGCFVVDPAYFPRELEAISDVAQGRGGAEAVVFTHGHWDHVMGHASFPGRPVMVSAALAEAVASGDPRAAKYLDEAREFDSRWYVSRPQGHAWPAKLQGMEEGTRELAGVRVQVMALRGHSPDGLGLLVEGVLLPGDHLSPCEIPFVDDVAAYQATLRRLLELLDGEVRQVIPGHGPRLNRHEAIAIAREDLEYLQRLEDGGGEEIALPRAAAVVGMRDQHRANCAKVNPVSGG